MRLGDGQPERDAAIGPGGEGEDGAERADAHPVGQS